MFQNHGIDLVEHGLARFAVVVELVLQGQSRHLGVGVTTPKA